MADLPLLKNHFRKCVKLSFRGEMVYSKICGVYRKRFISAVAFHAETEAITICSQYILNIWSEMASFEWQPRRSSSLRPRDFNCFIKFRGVPNHWCVYSLYILCCTANSTGHRLSECCQGGHFQIFGRRAYFPQPWSIIAYGISVLWSTGYMALPFATQTVPRPRTF